MRHLVTAVVVALSMPAFAGAADGAEAEKAAKEGLAKLGISSRRM